MSCPTCDHTMQVISVQQGRPTFWCPRCGSLDGNHHEQPALPQRVRQLLAKIDQYNPEPIHEYAWTLGVSEACGCDREGKVVQRETN